MNQRAPGRRRPGRVLPAVAALAVGALAASLAVSTPAQASVQASGQAPVQVGARSSGATATNRAASATPATSSSTGDPGEATGDRVGHVSAGTAAAEVAAESAHDAAQHRYVAPTRTKVNVMGEWAHPDDDTSIIGPCGVWHQRYGTRCGIIQITRGEGGGNAVGTESGPALGLRRENEDRVAHYRSGTADIYYVDRVDFFYNQSAPLTNLIWNHEETLRRVTRIIRTTQPDVYVGFTPTLAAGHGNHQVAGRLIWEGMQAAADPSMFPDQLRGPHALSTWQVKKVFSGGSTTGTGGSTTSAKCTRGFVPAADNPDTVAGVWTGYRSPYLWPRGNLQKQPVGTAKIWQQVNDEGRLAYPTQSRVMYQGVSAPGCPRFAMTDSFVPFQPNALPDGSANPAAGDDDAILFGATQGNPGGLPAGTGEHLSFSRFYNVPGVRFHALLHLSAGDVALKAGKVTLSVPQGWHVNGSRTIKRVPAHHSVTVRFGVTPGADATVGAFVRVAATYAADGRTGYTDNVVRVVPAVEGRIQRTGKWREYDQWLDQTAPAARRLGRSDPTATVGTGQTLSVPVEVHNWSDAAQSGRVSLDLPDRLSATSTTASYDDLAPGKTTTVTFSVTDDGSALPSDQLTTMGITTTSSATGSASAAADSSTEDVSVSVVPTGTVPESTTTPSVDAKQEAREYPGPELDIGRVWQGGNYCTGSADCGEDSAGGDHSWAKVAWHGQALYFYAHIRDDLQSYAVTPQECVAHWLADSVEFQIDPRGNASADARDTGSTFKLGVFPFTDDPSNTNGNGKNGPCWERDADNHQGYSTGPLAKTVAQAPNAPGVQVASSATWVGDNQTTTDHAYAGGGYDLEVKVPTADLPAAIDPQHMGLNITPYDEDDTAAAGSTLLRHIDNSARLGWSAFGSVQSDPFRWGRVTVPGYTPPASQPTTAGAPIVGHPNLDGTKSPQTIAQSARDGVPIAGRDPATSNDQVVSVTRPRVVGNRIVMTVKASGKGLAQVYGYTGNPGYTPVYLTSCSKQQDPPPDYGLTPCAQSDGGIPAWSPDMGGRLAAHQVRSLHAGTQRVTLPLDGDQAAAFRRSGRVLISFVGTNGGVQAVDTSS